jgi:hypothetical protein
MNSGSVENSGEQANGDGSAWGWLSMENW